MVERDLHRSNSPRIIDDFTVKNYQDTVWTAPKDLYLGCDARVNGKSISKYNSPMLRAGHIVVSIIIVLSMALAGCAAAAVETPLAPVSEPQPAAAPTDQPANQPEIFPQPTATPPTQPASLWLDVSVPDGMRKALQLPQGMRLAQRGERSVLRLTALARGESANAETIWVFALVAPFPTIRDGFTQAELRGAWQGHPPKAFEASPLLMSASTLAALEIAWGEPAAGAVKVLPAGEILDAAWKKLPAWAIVPFEELNPRWKVLSINNASPLEKDLDLAKYPLALRFGLKGISQITELPANWQPEKMTVLAMTGVTALVRKTAERMESQGVTYPAADIGELLRSADLTHISNEVPFAEDCPAPERRDPNFCSPPSYIELLEAVGTDIVELTGNHVMDRGAQGLLETLKAYSDEGWGVFGGGEDAETARAALLVEDHGNRLAFIGCNAAGPAAAWAGESSPGAAKCDYDWLADEISRRKAGGYLVIATLQHVEVCQLEPHLAQKADAGKLLKAGADIVSGSQAHCPQAVAFDGSQIVHYGLGNLFFDQMDAAARRQFIDRYIIYDGKLVSMQLVTTMLEDYARPRLMTGKERAKLLEDTFRASGWIK